ncbi:hypothetical protein PVMG_06065 [Plasmodium vivax Mauritania I]|uniref:VIR protein n=1 Tax=Plasmodium vivax Mauritania I TaxID=1035515 RepID=A0A0J9T586_PLAVI|nr:hypothetical protein PVMG_06065 [Plasmodium vivax Mauritania I]
MCGQFLKLYKSLSCYREDIQKHTTKINDCKFLNYWVNWKLNISKEKRNICVKKFYDDVVNHCVETFSPSSRFNLEHNINNIDLEKMNKLYNLYQKYHNLNSIFITSALQNPTLLLEPSNQCINEYNLARPMCYDENDKFCEKLRNFKSKYQNLYAQAQAKGTNFSKNFKRLPEEENSNIISSALLGSIFGLIPLFGLLYKVKKINAG